MDSTGTAIVPLGMRKACLACTRAKRKCDKRVPSCERCAEKDFQCRYPTTRRYVRVRTSSALDSPLLGDPTSPAAMRLSGGNLLSHLNAVEISQLRRVHQARIENLPAVLQPDAGGQDEVAAEFAGETCSAVTRVTDASWFLDVETWMIEHVVVNENCPPPTHSSSTNKRWVAVLWQWLRQWVEEGHNPFIHRKLYSDAGLPRCLQDAWTTLTAYFSKTAHNEDIILKIVEDRANDLVKAQPMESGSFGSVPGLLLQTTEHLARVQALFIYQFIRLFDGAIRPRALAEKEIPTLSAWCQQLWASVCLDANCQALSLDKTCFNSESVPELWKVWVLTESVRRTWLVAQCTLGAYLILRDGWTECPGGVMFTAASGLWDAGFSSAWASMVGRLETENLLVKSLHLDELVSTANDMEVDPFSTALTSLVLGTETAGGWAGG